MKIGILTLHRANNYGAVLQCYALQQALIEFGHDAWIIDYRQPDTELSYAPISKERMYRNLSNPVALAKDMLLTPLYYMNARGFNQFRRKYLRCTQPFNRPDRMPQNFNVYLIGSDQLWSIQCMGGHVEPVFFGGFPHPVDSRIMGYAISANLDSLNLIGVEQLKLFAANFDSVSVREVGIAQWLKANGVCEARIDLDPTLLLDPVEWVRIASEKRPSKKRYLLSYYLLPEQKAVAKNFARSHGLKYIELGHKAHSPADFLTWVKYADCVVGGSFHITVFSILFARPFYTIQKNSCFDIRSLTFLKAVGLETHFIPISELLQVDIDAPVNYAGAQASLMRLKKKSVEYLASL